MAFLDQGLQTAPRVVGSVNPRQILFRFTTDAGGVPTLLTTYDGSLPAPVQATNVYTCTIGSFKELLSCVVGSNTAVLITPTSSASAGTIILTASATLANATVDVIVTVDATT
jgi:hypothetical protein